MSILVKEIYPKQYPRCPYCPRELDKLIQTTTKDGAYDLYCCPGCRRLIAMLLHTGEQNA